ncbi:MAG: hypothetical protein Kow0056_04170 [Coriobacteriia bacterium]
MRDPDTDTRRGNPYLLVALVLLALALTTTYFREGDDGALHTARALAVSGVEPVATAGTWLATPFRAVGDWIEGLGAKKSELEALRAQNEELRARLAELEEARLENERLRRMVDFASQADFDVVGARVVGLPATSWDASIIIDRGSDDGIEDGMPVIAAGGVVGQVVDVGPSAAKVRLITDQRSGVAVMVQSSRVPGIARGQLDGTLLVDYIPAESAPEIGDVVLTSGMGGVYPKGLIVGDVIEVSEVRGGLFPKVVARSRVDVNGLEEVLIIRGPVADVDLGAGE